MKVKSRFERVSIGIFFNTLKTFMNDLLVLFEEFYEGRLNTREGQEKHTRERVRARARVFRRAKNSILLPNSYNSLLEWFGK